MKLWILALLVWGASSTLARAADHPDQQKPPSCVMSETMTQAVRGFLAASSSVGYRGTMLVEYGGDREFIAVHVDPVSGGNELTRLNRAVGATPRPVASLPRVSPGPCHLARYYGLAIEPGSAVAGRATYRLSARPRDTLRLAYVMDLDAEFHVPLRVLAASPEGQILERYEFADIVFSAKAAPASASVSDDELAASKYVLAALPPGFTIVNQGRQPVDFIVLSDGLANVSIFVENQPDALPSGEGFTLRGSSLTYTRGFAQQKLVTVLGEVPITTARLLAEALRQRGGTQ
ncbi:MAG: MucB/RseB C-terminal domain-containing protein [Luminiphilus sp.]|nr:MucB/RseB C-terminal domain-containing protein [Luminiphilus sp.]